MWEGSRSEGRCGRGSRSRGGVEAQGVRGGGVGVLKE